MEYVLRPKDVWPDSDAEGLRQYIREQWPQLADALDRECVLATTADLPAGAYTYKAEPTFARYPRETGPWHVLGTEEVVKPGTVIKVFNYHEKEFRYVAVFNIVASRLVTKRDGTFVTYVMATFDNIAEED